MKLLPSSLTLCVMAGACATPALPPTPPRASVEPSQAMDPNAVVVSPQLVDAAREYVRLTWPKLTRTNSNLLQSARDPKQSDGQARWPVYIADDENFASIRAQLQADMPAGDFNRIILRQLSQRPAHEEGVLYLPHPYVIPGGRFNEMYGWDSYFIARGLRRDGLNSLADSVIDNFLYEIVHYGSVLNANRSYYLSRSQPPMLSLMVLDSYKAQPNLQRLQEAWEPLQRLYRFWLSPPHTTATGLARYFDRGHGPAPEVVASEIDGQGLDAFERVRRFYRGHAVTEYDATRFYDASQDRLTPLFFVADRSMRESGFDTSNRFGPFSVAIIDYNPVCLNSLLYMMERDMARIADILGHHQEVALWNTRAAQRQAQINALMWDAKRGLYLDYDVVHGQRHDYPFLTTFYPLWAGIATAQQAAQVVGNLPLFERPGGLQTSIHVTNNQWDAPFGWAPLQLLAVEGLRRYGYHREADRISAKFIQMIAVDFAQEHSLFEKYDVQKGRSDLQGAVSFGYTTNEVGFGWTNAVFSELLAGLEGPKTPPQ